MAQERYAEAEPLYRRALALREEKEGPAHPDVAACLSYLGRIAASQGAYREAELLYVRALAILEKTCGSEHMTVVNLLQNMADVHHAQGRCVDVGLDFANVWEAARPWTKSWEELVGEGRNIRINFLSHETLDKLYFMVFPDGSLIVPRGSEYQSFGPFLEVKDFEQVISASQFDSAKHLRHSRGWGREAAPITPTRSVSRVDFLKILSL